MTRFLITVTLTDTLLLIGCQSPAPTPTTEEKAAAPSASTPPPRKMTALPVVGYARDQADLLKSSDPKLAANKKLAMFRIVNGKIVEHWDSATKGPGPTRAPAKA